MAREFKYQVQSVPSASTDGTGMVHFDVFAVWRTAGTDDPYAVIPGKHKTVLVPAADLATVNAMPHGSGAARIAKNTAYKTLVKSNLLTPAPTPPTVSVGWEDADFDTLLDANVNAQDAAANMVAYITDILAVTFPVNL
jgi:hypothetical protein